MSASITQKNEKLNHEQVAKYLREHRDFFVTQPDLLGDLELPHRSGQAVSLVEKQVAILRERNVEMRQRLSNLLDNARDNDVIFEKTKRLILALLECKTLASLTEAIHHSFEHEFNIHYTRIILFGSNGLAAGPARIESINATKEALGKRLTSLKAVSGGIDVKETEFLFDEDAPNVGSAALTVLSHGNVMGVLAIGNQDPTYYRSSMGTLFLGYIGEVLNRLLPRHL